ncbi:MAG: cysteine desulfurase family protein, partial [Verrucomicrobiota bacterium]
MAYFDNNATTPLDPLAEAVWLETSREFWHNPSSPYRAAAKAHKRLEEARQRLAVILGCRPEEVLFNSGATEGNNSLFQYFQHYAPQGRVVVSAIEHPCVLDSAQECFPELCELITVDSQGVIDLAVLDKLLQRARVGFVSCMAANNENGVIQPWSEVVQRSRKAGVPCHIDAAQWLGKRSAAGLGQADFVTGCAHKFGGPKGVGFLKLTEDHNGFQGFLGGGQEYGHRAGTENLPAILAMVAILEKRDREAEEVATTWLNARQVFEERLKEAVPGVRIIGAKADRLSNTSALIMPRFASKRWVAQLDRLGYAISTGSACATGKSGSSHVIKAMGFDDDAAKHSLRVSAGWTTQLQDWKGLAEAFAEAWQRLRQDEQQPARS